jgi:hypothetical protein
MKELQPYYARLKLWTNDVDKLWFSIPITTPYAFHNTENSYVVHHKHDAMKLPNVASYTNGTAQTRGLYQYVHCDFIYINVLLLPIWYITHQFLKTWN